MSTYLSIKMAFIRLATILLHEQVTLELVKVVQASFINNDETMHHVDEVGDSHNLDEDTNEFEMKVAKLKIALGLLSKNLYNF